MKRPKTRVDHGESGDLKKVIDFADFLWNLIDSDNAIELSDDIQNTLDEEFCGDCGEHNENCGCSRNYYERDYDYDDFDDEPIATIVEEEA